MKKLSCVIWIILTVTSCTRYAVNGENVYMLSHNGPRLCVPPPLSAACISSFYDLPSQDADPKVCLLPPIEPVVETDS